MLGDPTEGALIVAAHKVGRPAEALAARFARVGEIPFSSERKLMTTANLDAEHEDTAYLLSKGAPDVLLARCEQEWSAGEDAPADRGAPPRDPGRRSRRWPARRCGRSAWRSGATEPSTVWDGVPDAAEEELVWLGIIGMIDPPRPEATESVRLARRPASARS